MFCGISYEKMTRYKKADFEEDISSIGSVQLTEGVSTTATHIRYHTGTTLWRSRTFLEKLLILSVIILLVTVFVLSLALSATGRQDTTYSADALFPAKVPESEVCLSETCVKTAASLISSLDRSIDPCDDFYQFACGNWIKENPIPDGKSMWGTFVKLDQRNQLVVKNALEKPYNELKSKAEKKAKLYYMSCMDGNETIEALGAKPMLDLLKEVGGWSIAGNFSVEKWSLQNSLQILQNRYNMGGLFSWAVQEDDRNSSLHIIQVDQAGLTLPTRDTYLNATANEKILHAYLEYMTEIGVLLGGERNETRDMMNDVIQFETRLAEITIPSEERRDEEKMYNLMTIADLQELAPFISWIDYFSDALRIVQKKITSKEKIVVYAPKYLSNLTTIIEEYKNNASGKMEGRRVGKRLFKVM